nr:MAG TPA: hypothetical protein [Bacteriophage sp.]
MQKDNIFCKRLEKFLSGLPSITNFLELSSIRIFLI